MVATTATQGAHVTMVVEGKFISFLKIFSNLFFAFADIEAIHVLVLGMFKFCFAICIYCLR